MTVSKLSSHGSGDTLLERIKSDRSINPTGGHFVVSEEHFKSEVKLVPDEGNEIDDVWFSDAAPLWHTHDVMFAFVRNGELHFTQWDV